MNMAKPVFLLIINFVSCLHDHPVNYRCERDSSIEYAVYTRSINAGIRGV